MEKKPLNLPLITNVEELQSLVGEPNEQVRNKVISFMDSHVQHFLSMSPLFFLSTSDSADKSDVSPRGDEAGFVKVLDQYRLVYPERPGNRRIDSLLNILSNPAIGMIFLIPGMNEVLRINGRASITKDEEFVASLGWTGKTIGAAVIVDVEECFIHCPRAFKQAGLWSSETWVDKEKLPSTSEMFRAHLQINGLL
ncbi:MSMEG_1061 family FMN-dependent PPOX-type flavoprotein [Paenibacillus sp. QZ-Y1]|uniref:MSMEG_1061 family FMN-dependent PPOX-type flavoprotein n=1 Tax=Paenibacillus sp. QZ-Y1 TaxID=3414511 RepID=UPI003F797696